MKYLLIPFFLLITLSGCRGVHYKETLYPDGRLEKDVKYNVFGFDTKLGGLNIEADKESKKVSLQDLDTNSSNAMNVIGSLVNKIPSYGTVPTFAPAVIAPQTDVRPVQPRPATNPVR